MMKERLKVNGIRHDEGNELEREEKTEGGKKSHQRYLKEGEGRKRVKKGESERHTHKERERGRGRERQRDRERQREIYRLY